LTAPRLPRPVRQLSWQPFAGSLGGTILLERRALNLPESRSHFAFVDAGHRRPHTSASSRLTSTSDSRWGGLLRCTGLRALGHIESVSLHSANARRTSARAAFEAAWREYLPKHSEADLRTHVRPAGEPTSQIDVKAICPSYRLSSFRLRSFF
jgi:hypothetical protein